MDTIPDYPKILAYPHRNIASLFATSVVVQEKLDGSQIAFKQDIRGPLHVRSKNAPIDVDNPPDGFRAAIEHLKSVQNRLYPEAVYWAECMRSSRHNRLAYQRVPAGHLMLFDVRFPRGIEPMHYANQDNLRQIAEFLQIEAAPVLYQGMVTTGPSNPVADSKSLDDIIKLAEDGPSYFGPKLEGVVIKQYGPLGDSKNWLRAIGKIVSPRFKERVRPAGNGEKRDAIEELVLELSTEARFAKVVQHLRDAGTLSGEMTDIGQVLKELARDVLDEEGDYIRTRLWKTFWPRVQKELSRNMVEYYRRRITDEALLMDRILGA